MIETGLTGGSKVKALFVVVVIVVAAAFFLPLFLLIYPVTFGDSTCGMLSHLASRCKNWPRLSHETMMYINHQVRKFHRSGEPPKMQKKVFLDSAVFFGFGASFEFLSMVPLAQILIGCWLVSCLVVSFDRPQIHWCHHENRYHGPGH